MDMCKWLWNLSEDDSKPKPLQETPPFLQRYETNHRDKNMTWGEWNDCYRFTIQSDWEKQM